MDPAGFEEPASAEAAGQEWDTKMGPDCDSMFWEEFFHEIFEMVDLWTDTCSEVRAAQLPVPSSRVASSERPRPRDIHHKLAACSAPLHTRMLDVVAVVTVDVVYEYDQEILMLRCHSGGDSYASFGWRWRDSFPSRIVCVCVDAFGFRV